MIEPLFEKDIDSVFRLMKLNMASYYLRRDEKWSEVNIRKHFLAQGGLVILENDELKGFSFYELKEGRTHIHTLQIDPRHQNRTLGGQFFKWYKKLGRDIEADVITCGVYADNPARDMYKKIGFYEDGLVNGVVRMSLPITTTG